MLKPVRIARKAKISRVLWSSRAFLVLFGLGMLAFSIFLWKTQEARNLSQIESHTDSHSRTLSSEAEISFQKIYNALERMAKREALREVVDLDDWGKDAELYLASFQGIQSISWVDKDFKILRIMPLVENASWINKHASDLISQPSEVYLWLPSNNGATLQGFILGVIDVKTFISPVIVDIKNDYMLQISKEGLSILTPENWKPQQERYVVNRQITLQNAGVWNFSLAPTQAYIDSEIANSRSTLLFSLLFSGITFVAVYFAQNYNAISKKSALRFRKTLEGMMEGCQIIGTDWRYLFVNDTAAAQFHHSQEDMLGQTMMAVSPGIEKTDLFQLLQRCMDERTPQTMLNQFTFADGAAAWYQISIVPAPDGIFMLSTDVSERKHAEEAFRKSQLLLNETQRISKIGGWEFDLLTNKIVWTDEVYQIHGVTKAYDPSNPVQELQFFPSQNREMVSRAFDQLVENGEPYNLELQLTTAQGQKLWVQTIGQAEYQAGKITRIFGSIKDITERKQAEAILTQSELRFRTLFEQAAVGVALVETRTGRYVDINQSFCNFLGYTKEEMLNSTFQSVTHPDDTQENIDCNNLLLAGKIREFTIEKRYHRKDGRLVWGALTASPLWTPDEAPPVYLHITVVQDITSRKQAEVKIQADQIELQRLLDQAERSRTTLLSVVEDQKTAQEQIHQLNTELEQRVADRTAQLQSSNKELEAFAYSVSHDLRAPLRAIDGFSRILQQEYGQKLDTEGLRLLSIVRGNTGKMDRLITDLLALSRVGRSELKYTQIDMTALVNAIYHELATPEVLKKFVFTVADLPPASGDETFIRQVWANLISNAIKYTLPKEHCIIEISGSKKDGLCTYSIRDNGVGFNPKYTDKLFGLFQRLHKAEEFEGTGVGLAIVQRIIQRHGGQVWGEGQLGGGAAFSFTIPERPMNHA